MEHLQDFLAVSSSYLQQRHPDAVKNTPPGAQDDQLTTQLTRVTKILSVAELRRCLPAGVRDHELVGSLVDLLRLTSSCAATPLPLLFWDLVQLMKHACDQLPRLRRLAVVDHACLAVLARIVACTAASDAPTASVSGDRTLPLLSVIDVLMSPADAADPTCGRPSDLQLDVYTVRRLTAFCARIVGASAACVGESAGSVEWSQRTEPALAAAVLARLLSSAATGRLTRSCIGDSGGLKKRLLRSLADMARLSGCLLSQLCAAELLMLLLPPSTDDESRHQGRLPDRQLDQLLCVVAGAICSSVTTADRRLAYQCGRVLQVAVLASRAVASTTFCSKLAQLPDTIVSASDDQTASVVDVVCAALCSLAVPSSVGEWRQFWARLTDVLLATGACRSTDVLAGPCALLTRLIDSRLLDNERRTDGWTSRVLSNLCRLLETPAATEMKTSAAASGNPLSVAHVSHIVGLLETSCELRALISSTWRRDTMQSLFDVVFAAAAASVETAPEVCALTVRLTSLLLLQTTGNTDNDWTLPLLAQLVGDDTFLRLLAGAMLSRHARLVHAVLQLLCDQRLCAGDHFGRLADLVASSAAAVASDARPDEDYAGGAPSASSLAEIESVLDRLSRQTSSSCLGSTATTSAGSSGDVGVTDVMTLYEQRVSACRRDVAALERALDAQQQLHCASRRQLVDAERSAARCRQLLTASERCVVDLRQRLAAAETSANSLRAGLDEATQQTETARQAAEQQMARAVRLADQLTHRNQQLIQAQEALGSRTAEVEQLRSETGRLSGELLEERTHRQRTCEQLDGCEKQLQQSRQACDSIGREKETLQLLCKSHEQSLAESERRCAQLTDEVEQLRKIKDMIHSITKGAAAVGAE